MPVHIYMCVQVCVHICIQKYYMLLNDYFVHAHVKHPKL